MVHAVRAVEDGRASFGRQAWGDAYAQLSAAEAEAPLEREDLERLAVAAYLIGRDEESTEVWVRAHHECNRRGDLVGAARCALRLGTQLLVMGEMARGGGWLARARRMLELLDQDCVERGWLLVPDAIQCFDSEPTTAYATLGRAVEIGVRFGDPDLVAMARNAQGWALIRLGQTAAGAMLLDEAMVAVTAGEVSPFVAGGVYCAAIEACQECLRPASGTGVDGSADPLVRVAARPGPLPRAVPGVSGRDHAAAGRLARRLGGSAAGTRPALRPPCGRDGVLPTGRAAPAAG